MSEQLNRIQQMECSIPPAGSKVVQKWLNIYPPRFCSSVSAAALGHVACIEALVTTLGINDEHMGKSPFIILNTSDECFVCRNDITL